MSKKDEKDIHITHVSDNVIANTAAIVSETFRSPGGSSIIFSMPPTSGPIPPIEIRMPPTGPAAPPPPDPSANPPAGTRARTLDHAGPKEPRKITLKPNFKILLIIVTAATLIAFIAGVVMAAIWTMPTPHQLTVMQTADFVVKAGVGALFGLLGGKQT